LNEKVTIIIIVSGFRYTGSIIKENEEFISILDEKENKQIDFPKNQVMIIRGAKDGMFNF
jgi:hypothetical protein